jgi:trimeric autotransporter adhesin
VTPVINPPLKHTPSTAGLLRAKSDLFLTTEASDFWRSTDGLIPDQPDTNAFGYCVPFAWTPLQDLTPPTSWTAATSFPASVSAGLTQVLYLQEAGNTATIAATDINQGQMGDCYLLSSIGEIALFHPTWITSMIQANTDGTETVTLYRAANGSLPGFGTTSFKSAAISVTNSFPTNSVNSGANQDVFNGQREIWVQVLEKAVANLYGSYTAIANGGCPVIAMEELTGCSATYVMAPSLSLQQLQTAIAANNLITFDTLGSGQSAYGQSAYGLYGSHAYMFQSLSTVGGTVMVNLLNPWGFSNPQPIPFSKISSVFAEIDFGHISSQPPVETAPTVANQTANQTWTAGSTLLFALPANTFSAIPGQSLTYAATLPAGLTINPLNDTISGIVPFGLGANTIRITAIQTNGLSVSETFTATIVASAPTLTNRTTAQAWTANQKAAFTLPANTFTDPQHETLTYTVAGLPTGLTFNSATMAITGTTATTLSTSTITVTARDQSGLSASETFQATITAAAPIVSHTPNQSWTANKMVSLSVASAFSDPQGEKLTYTATLSNGKALPTGLTFTAATATFSGIAPTTLGGLGITVTATNQSGLSSSETFQAVIAAAAPTVGDHPVAALWTAGKVVSFTPGSSAFTDPQGEKLTYTATQSDGSALPSWLKFNPGTDAFSGTAPITPQTLGLTVTATNASGLAASEAFSATIQAVAPSVAHQTANQLWAGSSSMNFLLPSNTFSDPQGAALAYAAYQTSGADVTAWLRFLPGSAHFVGTVPTALTGTIGIKVVATNAYGLSASESFGLTLAPSGSHLFAAAATNATELLAFHA